MKFRIEGRFWKNEKTFPGLNDYIHELGRNPKSGAHIKKKYEKEKISEENQHFLSYFLEKSIAKNKLYCYYKRVK